MQYIIIIIFYLFTIYRVQKKGNNIVLYNVTFAKSNIVFFIFGTQHVEVLQNYYYNECSPHLISVVTLP